MMNFRKSEHGQALILIVFAMVGLIAATALAIDGGNVYSDRRHAQNAADTAVMAAGLTEIRTNDWPAAQAAAWARARDNGYDKDDPTKVVQVYRCSDAGANCTLPALESDGSAVIPSHYVKVTITSTIPTYFARVVGVSQLTNSVQAIAKAKPREPTRWMNGDALVALMPGCQGGGWPNVPFEIGGSSISIINGSGVFVNSNCDPAFVENGSPDMTVNNGNICVVGGVPQTSNVNPPPQGDCGSQIDLQTYQLPAVDPSWCATTGAVSPIGPGNYVATPGRYSGSFPGGGGGGHLQLMSGVYCLDNGLSLQGTWDITTDLNGNGTYDGSNPSDPYEGVMFYVRSGGVTFNGSSTVHIGAMNKIGTNEAVKGYLMYLPPTNSSTVKLTGGNGSVFVGTVLAPASLVTLQGSEQTQSPGSFEITFDCQIIGYSLSVSGNGTLNIAYDGSQNAIAYYNPKLQLYK